MKTISTMEVQEMIQKLQSLSKQAGSQSGTPRTYKCHKCRDYGSFTYWQDNFEYYQQCDCIRSTKSQRIFESSQITIEFKKKTFNTWNTENLDTIVRQAHQCAMSYTSKFDKIKGTKQNSIALLGQSGAGKTHLITAIANALITKEIHVLYFPFVEGFNEIKSNLDKLEQKINEMQKVEVLFIDDLFKGRTQPTAFQIEQIFSIINYRYMNNLPILISSERMMEELLDIDEAIGSRIYEMSKDFRVELSGKSLNYRMRDFNNE